MEIAFSVTFQIVSSIFLIFLFISIWKCIRKNIETSKIMLFDLVFFFSISKVTLYYFLPATLRAFSGMSIDLDAGRDPVTIANIYAIEVVSWLFWLVPFLAFSFVKNKPGIKYNSEDWLRLKYSKYFLVFLVFGFFITRLQIILQGEVSGILIAFQSVFSYAGKAAGPLLLVVSIKYFGRKYFLIGLFGTIFGIASYGTRGALVYTFILLVFISFFILKNKKVNKVIIFSFVSLALSFFLLGGLTGISYTVNEDGETEIGVGLNERKLNELNSFQKIEDRFGAPTRIGSAFIDMYERGESANGAPIINSALAFLPRALNPEKPIPNTLNGDDLYSQGMYLIFREVYGYNTFQMVEFPTGGHFYWQFGYLGVVLLSLISGIYILGSVIFYSRFGIVGIAFLFAAFKPWGYVDTKIWVSDIVLQSYQVVLPILVLVFLFGFISRILKGLRLI
ncbi:hypothetical protein ACIL2N_002632 [Vibrio metschnikovii]|uniref:hypothetical protein n=1 Tax=Vibrio metschnikovii TaxID=28172 RepID=UPI00165DA163|nr:hypothetical protein [Vibrio metschnikovii]